MYKSILVLILVLIFGSSLSQKTPPPQVLIAVGDISTCGNGGAAITAGLTKDLLKSTPQARVALLGDIAYERGTDEEFKCFDATWGDLKPSLYPAPGNHEYYTKNAAGYYRYFGARAGDPKRGYYSYTLGNWQILSLNSNCDATDDCGSKSGQVAWIKSQLKQKANCRLAYWHHPRFSSGLHGNAEFMQSIWAVLAEAGVDVVLSGHDHTYERFVPLDASGKPNPKGTRAFVVGTGGRSFYEFKNPNPNSAARQNSSFGVLRLELLANGYNWRFVAQAGAMFADSGSGIC